MLFLSALDDLGESFGNLIKQAFDVNLTEFLINVIATIILILIVRFFFWNKVTAFLDKKKEKIKEDYERKEDLTKEAEELKAQAQTLLEESKRNANKVLKDASDIANNEKNKIIDEAKVEASNIIVNAKEKAQLEKENIINEAKDEVVEIASLMASKIIDKEIDPKKYNENLLKDLEEK